MGEKNTEKMAAPAAPQLKDANYVVTTSLDDLLHCEKKEMPEMKYRAVITCQNSKHTFEFCKKFRDMLTQMQFGTWEFEVKEETKICKHL